MVMGWGGWGGGGIGSICRRDSIAYMPGDVILVVDAVGAAGLAGAARWGMWRNAASSGKNDNWRITLCRVGIAISEPFSPC